MKVDGTKYGDAICLPVHAESLEWRPRMVREGRSLGCLTEQREVVREQTN